MQRSRVVQVTTPPWCAHDPMRSTAVPGPPARSPRAPTRCPLCNVAMARRAPGTLGAGCLAGPIFAGVPRRARPARLAGPRRPAAAGRSPSPGIRGARPCWSGCRRPSGSSPSLRTRLVAAICWGRTVPAQRRRILVAGDGHRRPGWPTSGRLGLPRDQPGVSRRRQPGPGQPL